MDAAPETTPDPQTRWLILLVLCLGILMIMLDTTIVNVALPTIRNDLHFTDTTLVWVVNAYLLTFGGFLLLGGRLGDLYGQRRLFLTSTMLFTISSLGCGLANTQSLFIAARALQGLNAAILSSVTLALIVRCFTDQTERAKAMGVYGFVGASGGTIGVLFGGTISSMFSWHWIFLINVPIGLFVFVIYLLRLPDTPLGIKRGRLDVWGAITVTSALIIAVYAIINGNEAGWTSSRTLGLLATTVALFALALMIESRESTPLIRLGVFRQRNLMVSSTVGILWAAGTSGAYFSCVLYMQRVLGYDALQVALAFLPVNLIMAAFALGLSSRIVMLFGINRPIGVGLLLGALGLALFARAPVHGDLVKHILPSMILIGLGTGIAFNPVLLAGMSDAPPEETGLASGIMNTSSMMGGAVGLAILAALSAARTDGLLASGAAASVALTYGYRVAFIGGAACAGVAAVVGVTLLPASVQSRSPSV